MKEGYIVCEKCNGHGTLDANEDPTYHVFPCPKCLGCGELDWVENVVGKRVGIRRSALDDINVKRLTNYITKSIEKVILSKPFPTPPDSIRSAVSDFLEKLHMSKSVFDFQFQCK
jgi:hypothetical protein